MRKRSLVQAMSVTMALAITGCATTRIEGTDVPDTRENHAAIDVAERYRNAVQDRNVDVLLSMVSPNYFEDGGTPEGDDDYGVEGLRRLFSIWSDEVRSVRYEIRYRRVTYEGSRLLIDYTYTGSFTLKKPPPTVTTASNRHHDSFLTTDPVRGATPVEDDQEIWYRRVADNRLEFEKVDGEWKIIGGM